MPDISTRYWYQGLFSTCDDSCVGVGVFSFLILTPQEIAYKEKRAGDARDSWYIREGFEGLLEEGLGKHYPPGEALQADADAKDRAKASFL